MYESDEQYEQYRNGSIVNNIDYESDKVGCYGISVLVDVDAAGIRLRT